MRRLPKEPPAAEITPEAVYQRRRDFLKNSALFAASSTAMGAGLLGLLGGGRGGKKRTPDATPPGGLSPVPEARPNPLWTLTDPPTPYESITSYNNFYEFGLEQVATPPRTRHSLPPAPVDASRSRAR